MDASSFELEATLSQRDSTERERIFAYASGKTTAAEQNSSTNHSELLGLVHGLQRVRCYLEGSEFTVFTDNQVVSHLFSKKHISRREARRIEVLANFNISALTLKPGRINVLGDALSLIGNVHHIHGNVQHNHIDLVYTDDSAHFKALFGDYATN